VAQGWEHDVARRLFTLLVRRARGATELVEDLLGRPVHGRLIAEGELPRIAPPGLTRLATTGPVLRRHVLLTDSEPPHLPVAVVWSVLVAHRLPVPVVSALRDGGEPLDRLLVRHGVNWSSRPVETEMLPAGEASTPFPWAPPGTTLVEQARVVHLDHAPVAITIDEIPFLVPRDAGEPLLPLHPTPHPHPEETPCSGEQHQ
jgi:hypothetical protein